MRELWRRVLKDVASLERLSLDADADDVTKQRQLSTNLHTKPRLSSMKFITVKRNTPEIWNEIMKLEPSVLTFHPDGLRIQPKIYIGLQRSGLSYLDRWLDENHISVSPIGMIICRALASYKRFTTYDELFEFLRDENCGGLEPEKPKDQVTILMEQHFKETRK